MDKVAYAALVAFGSFTTGMGLMAAVYYFRSVALVKGSSLAGHSRRHLWLGVSKTGVIVTQAILLWRVVTVGQLDATPAVGAYLVGLAITGVGIMGQCAMLYKDLPEMERIVREERESVPEREARGGRESDEERVSREAEEAAVLRGRIEGTIEGEVK